MKDTQTPNTKNNEEEDNASSDHASTPINLQKRKAEVEPTRYGDWELNGRCIDF